MVSKRKSRQQHSQPTLQSEEWPEKMRVSQARKFLGVSESKMTFLLSSGLIPYLTDPVDLRVKLIRRSDLEALLNKSKQD